MAYQQAKLSHMQRIFNVIKDIDEDGKKEVLSCVDAIRKETLFIGIEIGVKVERQKPVYAPLPCPAEQRENLLRSISGKILCYNCRTNKMYIGNTYENPSLFCVCGNRVFVKFFVE